MSAPPSILARLIREDLAGKTYSGVETVEHIADKLGINVSQIVKLNANENIYGTPQAVIDAAVHANHHFYPDPSQERLRKALAKSHNTTPDRICCGAGSDDILDILIRAIGPSCVVTSDPTFGMYKFLADVAGTKFCNVKRRADFTVDVEAVKATVLEKKATIVFLASPNNPTGTLLPLEDIKALLALPCLIVIDEAYADFTDQTALDLGADYENLVVCRTFSKWAGLAGLRLGYSIAHADLTRIMLAIKQPYNVNTAAEAAGLAALEHHDEIMVTVNLMRQERDRLFQLLKENFDWLEPVPSQANFVLVKVLRGEAKDIYDALYKQGIIVRYFGKQGGDLESYFRISAGRPEHTDAIIAALKAMSN